MRIVDRRTFLALPAGTVFATYRPCIIGEPEMKGDIRGSGYDVIGFLSPHVGEYPDSHSDACDRMERESVPLEVYSQMVSGDDCQQFVIYEPADVAKIIALLQGSHGMPITSNPTLDPL